MSAAFSSSLLTSWGVTNAVLAAMAGKSKVTISCWRQAATYNSADGFCYEYNQPWSTISGGGSFVLDHNSGSNTFVGCKGNVGINSGTTPQPADANWHLDIVVFDFSQAAASEVTLYVDGSLKSLTKVNAENTGTFVAALFTIGARWDGSNATQRFTGKMDDVAIWAGTALGSADRALVYNGHPNDVGLSVQPDYYWPLASNGTATVGGIDLTFGAGVTFSTAHPNPNPGTFAATPSPLAAYPAIHYVPGNAVAQPTDACETITLTGTGTSWSPGSTSTFGISNSGCVVTLNAQYVLSATLADLIVDAGTVAGTLTITDGTGATGNTVAISAAAATTNQVIAVGDSLTVEFTSGPCYANRLGKKLGKSWKVHAMGKGGTKANAFPWTNAEQADPDNAAACYDAAAGLSVFVVGGCLNNFGIGSPDTPSAVYATYKSRIAAVKAYGANVRVIVWTTPPCDTGIGLTNNPSINANVASLNALLRAGYASGDLGANTLIDLAADARWNAPAAGYNPAYIQAADFTHWMPPIKESLADKVVAAIDVFSNGGGAVPGSGGGGTTVNLANIRSGQRRRGR